MLDKPKYTQILGVPRKELIPSKGVYRRTIQNFSFADPTHQSDSPALTNYRYVVLDIDKDIRQVAPLLAESEQLKPLLHEFKELYETYELHPRLVLDTVRHLVQYAFGLDEPYRGELIVRLSASFGKPRNTFFRGHVYVPLTESVSVDDIQMAIYNLSYVDRTPYFNPTQPIFTAGPIKDMLSGSGGSGNGSGNAPTTEVIQIEDGTRTVLKEQDTITPLSNFTSLKSSRIMFSKGDGTYMDHRAVTEYAQTAILARTDEKKQHRRPRTSRGQEAEKQLPATQLSGKRGAFNRMAVKEDEFSISTWLSNYGYVAANDFGRASDVTVGKRWLAPDSSSGQPGTIVFNDGYVVEYHENGIINTLGAKYLPNKRAFSAYDLWYIHAEQLQNPGKFRRMVDRAISADHDYRSVWCKRIATMVSHIQKGMPTQDIEDLVSDILNEVYYHGLKQFQREQVYTAITTAVRDLEIKDYKLPKATLERKFKNIANENAIEYSQINAANADTTNAITFLDTTQVYRMDDGSYLAETSTEDSMLILRTREEKENYLGSLMIERSNSPHDWNSSKIRSSVAAILKEIEFRYSQGRQKSLNILESAFLFKTHKHVDRRVAINFRTGETFHPSLDQHVMHTLPFTLEEYEKQKHRPFKETSFGKFLLSTFENRTDNIKHVRDVFTYVLKQDRDQQKVQLFIGLSRSGKSTLKNLLVELAGSINTIELLAQNASNEFSLSNLHAHTRLIIFNEFNMGEKMRRNMATFNMIKAASGRDTLFANAKFESPRSVKTNLLPIIIANQTPMITDPALTARIKVIRFNKSFHLQSQKAGIEFWNRLKSDLSFIFQWAMTNPRYDGKNDTLDWLESDISREDFRNTRTEADVYGTFFENYLCEATDDYTIIREELIEVFKWYYASIRGYDVNEADIMPQRFGINQIQRRIPSAKTCKVHVSASRQKIPGTEDRLPTGSRKWGIRGVKWRDYEGMIRELTPFSEVLDDD
jgi:hypothetical protein